MPAGFHARGFDAKRLDPLMSNLYALAEDVGGVAYEIGSFGQLITLALARACQSARSAYSLSGQGLNGDAMTVARTAVEIAIDVSYVALDHTRVELFKDYDEVRKHELAVAIDELHDGTIDRAVMAEFARRADEARARHPAVAIKWNQHKGWAGVSIKARATEGGREQLYKLLYRDMCDASHSGYGSLEYAIADLNGDPKITFEPQPPDEGAAVLAAGAVLNILSTAVDNLRLDASFGERAKSLFEALSKTSPGK